MENWYAGGRMFKTGRLIGSEQFSLGGKIPQLGFDTWVGQNVDFANNRLARGASFNPFITLRPTNHLQLDLSSGLRWLSAPTGNGGRSRIFTSQVERIRASYTFNSKMFLRAILQNARTNRNPSLYDFEVNQHSGSFASQILFAYKVNWQTVMYFGYGDLRDVMPDLNAFRPANRQLFFKTSYAFQR